MKSPIEAIIRHEKAIVAVKSLTRKIGQAFYECDIDKSLRQNFDPEMYDERQRVKNHLWQAFRIKDVSACGYGEVFLDEDGVRDALSQNGELECAACLKAFELILLRKQARKDLGSARRSIRLIGRTALRRIN